MKALRIFFICFLILYTIVIIWFDKDVPFKPIYWLVAKLCGALIFLAAAIIIRYKEKEESKLSFFFSVLVMIISVGYFLFYKQIAEYKRDTRLDKFGLVFNKTRQKLGIPQIPSNWHIDFRMNNSVDWKVNDSTTGHFKKSICLDSIYNIKYERDDYSLKPLNKKSRVLSIISDFGYKERIDSMVYFYEIGDTTYDVSKRQVDSIFNSEKIAKDY